jgi:hypothetical protein
MVIFNVGKTLCEAIKFGLARMIGDFIAQLAGSIFPPLGLVFGLISVYLDYQETLLMFSKMRILGRNAMFNCDANSYMLFWFKEKMVNVVTFGLYEGFFGSPKNSFLDTRICWADQNLDPEVMSRRSLTQAGWVFFRSPGISKGKQLQDMCIKSCVCCPCNIIGYYIGTRSWLQRVRMGGLGVRYQTEKGIMSMCLEALPKCCGLIGAPATMDGFLEAYDPALLHKVTASMINSGEYKPTVGYMGWAKELFLSDGGGAIVPNPDVYGTDFDSFKTTTEWTVFNMKLTCIQSCTLFIGENVCGMLCAPLSVGIPYAGVFLASIYKPLIEFKRISWFWEKARIGGNEIKFHCAYKSFYMKWLTDATMDNLTFGLWTVYFGHLRAGWLDAHLTWKADECPLEIMDKKDTRQIFWVYYRASHANTAFMLESLVLSTTYALTCCCVLCFAPIASIPLRYLLDLWLKKLRFDSIGVRIRTTETVSSWASEYGKQCLWASKGKKMVWLDTKLELWNTRGIKPFNMNELMFGGPAPSPAAADPAGKGTSTPTSTAAPASGKRY